MSDKFLIAPFKSGLVKNLDINIFWYIYKVFERYFMYKLRKGYKNINGQRFYKLVVVKPVKYSKFSGVHWLCKCDCGNTRIVYGGHLRSGSTRSCGCIATSRYRESARNQLLSRYKTKAKNRGFKFLLTTEEFDKLISGNCFYCGIKPSRENRCQKSKKVRGLFSGIDRVNTLGNYEVSNCVSCCTKCNMIKGSMSLGALREHIGRMYKCQISF